MRWILAVVVVVGCGSSNPGEPDAPHSGDIGMLDTGCAANEMLCDGMCVDLMSDPMHCGSCPMTCSGQMSSCAGGMCHVPHETTWVVHYGGPDFGYFVEAVAVDAVGNVYIAGAMLGTIDLGGGPLTSAGTSDILVASFSPTGVHRWSKRYGGSMIDQASAITVDGQGNVYVVADFFGSVDFGGGALVSAGRDDIVVLELAAANGAYVAARRFGTVNGDAGLGVVVDANHNVTVGGFFGAGTVDFGGGATLTGTGQDNAFVASFTSSGTHRWSRRLGGSGTALSSCQALAVDGSGNITTTGSFNGTTDFGAGNVTAASGDIFVASYTTTGTPRFSHEYGASGYDSGDSIAIAANGSVIVSGNYHGSINFGGGPVAATGIVDGFILVLDTAGQFKWARHLGAMTNSGARVVRADPAGNVVVAGHVEGTADLGTGALAPIGLSDLLIAQFAANDGVTQFARRLGGIDYEDAYGLDVGAGGEIAVGGYFRGTADLGTGPIVGGARDNGFVMVMAP